MQAGSCRAGGNTVQDANENVGCEISNCGSSFFSPMLFSCVKDCGIHEDVSVTEESSEMDFFFLFDDQTMDKIMRERNTIHEYHTQKTSFPPKSGMHKGTPPTRDEIYVFLVLSWSRTMLENNKWKITEQTTPCSPHQKFKTIDIQQVSSTKTCSLQRQWDTNPKQQIKKIYNLC